MNMLANSVHISDRLDHSNTEIIGMRTCEAKSPDPIDISNSAQQISEVELAIVVGVYGLSKQHYLGHSIAHYLSGLANDIVKTAAPLRAARGGNDAVSAAIITSPLHRNPRLYLVEPSWLEILVMFLEIEVRH
jgi:hypothetical protein